MNKKPIRIGITLPDHNDPQQALWGSGHVQNAVFLERVFSGIKNVKVFAVGSFAIAKALKMQHTNNGPGYLNVLIEVGSKINLEAATAFTQSGGLLVHYVMGNTLALNIEATVNRRSKDRDVAYGKYHRVWMMSHQLTMNFDYYSILYKTRVDYAPVVWSPEFLPKEGFGYTPQKKKIVACFEPSVSVVKVPHWSMLIGEQCEMTTTPMIDEFRVFSALDLYNRNSQFRSFANSLDILNKTTFYPRVIAPLAFKGLSAIVSHQWCNEYNYNHWEALHGGYPLVHNSQGVGAGYKFKSWDAEEGGVLLNAVLQEHDEHHVEYQEIADHQLSFLHPNAVRSVYEQLLHNLLEDNHG